MPYYRKELKKWQGIVNKLGKRTTKLFAKKRDAIEWEKTFKEESLVVAPPTVRDWINSYYEFSTRFRPSVQAEKRHVLEKFIKFVGEKTPTPSITPHVAMSHVYKEARTRTHVGVNKDIVYLKAAWSWGIKFLGLASPSPFALIEKFPVDRSKKYAPPESDFWKVYDVADPEDKTMLATFLFTGARRSEVFRLRWVDIDFENSTITLSTRKRAGGNLEYDTLPMIQELLVALAKHPRKSEYVFPAPANGETYLYRRHFLMKMCKKAGVKYFSYHAIRRLTASILAASDVPMVDIQAILRHTNLQTTERYIQRIGALNNSMSALSPSQRQINRNSATKVAATSLRVINGGASS